MAQATMTIADGSGATVLAEINAALAALVSENSGASAPTTTFPFMTWANTATGLLMMRDSTNSYWIVCQPLSVVGTARNLKASLTAAATSITFTADEVILETALGGTAYKIANLNKTLNMAGGPGAGYMDTGAAGPVSGFCAVYAIYNPTTQNVALLGYNATSVNAPNVYGGANMPAGYTASALLSVWPTNAASQFVIGLQLDRLISIYNVTVLNTSTLQGAWTSLSIASAVPLNAKTISGYWTLSNNTANASTYVALAASVLGVGAQLMASSSGVSAGGESFSFSSLSLLTPQTLYYEIWVGSGTPSVTLNISSYTI